MCKLNSPEANYKLSTSTQRDNKNLQTKYNNNNNNNFPFALQPNSGLGRLHETLRFTSVTRSRAVGTGRYDSLDGWSARRKASTCIQTQKNAHTTQTLNIHAPRGNNNNNNNNNNAPETAQSKAPTILNYWNVRIASWNQARGMHCAYVFLLDCFDGPIPHLRSNTTFLNITLYANLYIGI
jgi:hypothetical protein